MAPIINFVDGKLDLVCSIRYDASEADIELWKNSIIHASKILLHATDNQVQFGKLTIHNKSTGGYFANAFLHENCGRSTTGVRVHLCRDEQSSPFTIIHELGHHVFKLHDEYMNDSMIV